MRRPNPSHRYDLYAPVRSVLFHEYALYSARRKAAKVPTFYETPRPGVRERSIRRLTALIGLDPNVPADAYSAEEAARYGVGRARPAALFYRLFLIDVHTQTTRPLCPWVRSARMHRDFTKHIRPDGRGIDYSALESYNTSLYVPVGCSDRIFCTSRGGQRA